MNQPVSGLVSMASEGVSSSPTMMRRITGVEDVAEFGTV